MRVKGRVDWPRDRHTVDFPCVRRGAIDLGKRDRPGGDRNLRNSTIADQTVRDFIRQLAILQIAGNLRRPFHGREQILQPDLAGGSKSGYQFNITNCTKSTVNNQDQYTSFEATAVPSAVGKTGHNGFCLDMSGQILKDPTGGTNCTVPIQ